jgi:farnesyl diphosphate synthase
MSFEAWMSAVQHRTEQALKACLPAVDKTPSRLHEAMHYAVLGGGKRVRPLLSHAAGAIFGADSALLDRAACAVELIHAYSLVHDDLPAMDNDVLRRGKPTCHVQFDEATALLVGDALQALAFELAAQPMQGVPAERQLAMVRELGEAAGSRGMAGGQAFDLQSVGARLELTELEFMHIHKTGALIRAAVLLGAQVGGAGTDNLERLTRFANRAGLLFQVADDILDASVDTATLGKTAGKDAAANKPTYVTLLGLSQAREFAEQLRDEARAALQPFGDRAQRLLELTDFIVDRKY